MKEALSVSWWQIHDHCQPLSRCVVLCSICPHRKSVNKMIDLSHRKAINNAYEEYVLSVGDFDERIFLGEDAEEEIGTPGGQRVANLSDEMHRRSLKQHVEEVSSVCVCMHTCVAYVYVFVCLPLCGVCAYMYLYFMCVCLYMHIYVKVVFLCAQPLSLTLAHM